ncbi:MAG: DUF6273 domain-containing protein [Roseburia sp.]|nr:DUF6273 domain-containing protein [Roseburia sp.]MCM1278988.1 DUF6273 domain-containing protein [Robinsoniella sp.]
MYRKKNRLLSMVLAMSVLLAGNGITLSAQTVSENGVTLEQDVIQDNDNPAEQEEAVLEQPNENSYEEQELIFGGNVSENNVREGERMPKAPVHHCTKDIFCHYCGQDSTVWSYLYFGSYPQSEVTDSSIIESIEEAISTSGIQADIGTDVWVDDVKYRRISSSDTNNSYNFGYNQYRYFKWEPIKWKVLQNDGDTLFVLAEAALDCEKFYGSYSNVKWENSTIRSWLNESFYNTAFSSNEQKAIVKQDTTNEGRESTQDLVYLMSLAEMGDRAYGFCSNDSTYVQSLMVKPSAYGMARGAYSYGKEYCYWWLRTPSPNYGNAMAYDYNGSFSEWNQVDRNDYGVRPALHIDLSSKAWLLTDEPVAGENGVQTIEAPSGPFHHCSAKGAAVMGDDAEWDYVYLGSYPQTEVTDSDTIAAIEGVISQSGTEADAGIDVVVDGTKYRRISKNDTNYDRYFGNDDDYRYFKWEKIKWRVLENNGSTLFVIADNALDCKNYNDPLVKSTWENSTLRSWLNDSFYNMAFSSDEQKAIEGQKVINASNPVYGTEGGKDTTDKLYLLSIGEGMDESYGFCSEFCNYSSSRKAKASDYAGVRGTYKDKENNCVWWLRSPGRAVNNIAVIGNNGNVHREGNNITSPSNVGVCPVLHIKLESKAWSMTDGSTNDPTPDNPDPDNPNPDNPDPDNPNPDNPDPDNPNPDNPDPDNPNPDNPDPDNPNPDNPDPDNPTPDNPDPDNPTPDNPDPDNPNPDNPDPDNPNPDNPDPDNPTPDNPDPDNPTPDNPDPDNPNPDNPNPDNPTPDNPDPDNSKPSNSQGEGSNGNTKPQNDPVKVTDLTISAPSKRLAAGQKVKLALKISPENAANKKVTWTTSNKKYATVDENGKVSLKAAGAGKNVTITVVAGDGSGKKATIKIKIMKHKVKSIKLKASSKTVKAGKSLKLSATVKTTGKSVNKTLKWSSSNTGYATVDKSGKVTAKKSAKGKTVTITAASTDGTNKKAKLKIKIK